jgi:hypothetical protein
MKLKLQCNVSPKAGYLNVDTRPHIVSPHLDKSIDFCVGSYSNLKPIIGTQLCEEIIFGEPLNTISPKNILQTMSHWCDSLTDDGKLIVYFVDVDLVAKYIMKNNVTEPMINSLFLGPDRNFESCLNYSVVEKSMEAIGMRISSVSKSNDAIIKIEVKKI